MARSVRPGGGGRRGWIKGPPVLHGMINDLQRSGGQLLFFLIGQTLTGSRQRSDRRVSVCVKREERRGAFRETTVGDECQGGEVKGGIGRLA